MELKVLLLLFLGIGFCFAKPFPGSESIKDNSSSPNSKLIFILKDEDRHLPLGPESDEERDETPSNTEHSLQIDDISESGGHLDPISSSVKHIIVKDSFHSADLPPNPIQDFITQQKVNPSDFPDSVSSLIEDGFQLANDIRDTSQAGNISTNILNFSDFYKDNVEESMNEYNPEFPQPTEANATGIKPDTPIQRSIDDVADLIAFDDGEVIPSAKLEVAITSPDEFKIGEHFKSNDIITENSDDIAEHPLTSINIPLVKEEHLSGTRHARHAEIIIMNIPSIGLRSGLLDNVNVADFIQSESTDKKPELPKKQSEFDKSDWGSSETAEDDEDEGEDEDEENLKLGERFGEDLEFNHSDPYIPSDQDHCDKNDTIVLTIASSVLKSFLLGKVSDFHKVLQEKPDIEIIAGGKKEVTDRCSYGNNSGVIEKFGSEKGVYPFDNPNVEVAAHIFKPNPIKYYDDEDYGFNYPRKVAVNDSERESFFRSLTDEVSPLIKSPVNFSELHQREDVKNSNDKFEEKIIKSAFKTLIDGATRKLKPQPVSFPGLVLFKTLTEEENDANSTQPQKLARSITDGISKENINDNNQTTVEKRVYPFDCSNEEEAPDIFKHISITCDDEEDGFNFPIKVAENDSELIHGRPSTDDSTSDFESLDIKKGSFFRSLADDLSPIIKSPVNFSELHEREDVKKSNDGFEEKIIKSAFKTLIHGATKNFKPQPVSFPGLVLFKTLTEEENDANSTQQQIFAGSIADDISNENDNHAREARSPSKELVSHFFTGNDSLPEMHDNNANTNSRTSKQKQEKQNGSDHQSKQKPFLETFIDEGFNTSNIIKTSIKERFRRYPRKELVSPFFDQVLDDGSLPEEHNNNTNTEPKQEVEHGKQIGHNESKPKTLLRKIIDNSFRISDAVKSSINKRFGHSIENLTVLDDIGGKTPRVERSPRKGLVSPFFDLVLEDGSLPDERRNPTNTNSSTTNQDHEREVQNESDDKESIDKSFVKIIVDESFRISDAVKRSLKDTFERTPSKVLTSSFFDQVLEDGSLPEEHKNNTNSNTHRADHENKNHEEGKPESFVKAMVEKTFRFSDAVKTSINERFGRSTGNSTVREEDKSPSDNHGKQTRVARSPSREQVSSFFDEVLEDGSLPAEHNNSHPTKSKQDKTNISVHKESKPISLFKIVIDDSLRISDTVKASIKDRFGRAIINSTEQNIFDDNADKDNAEVNDHKSQDIIFEGHRRKRRSLKVVNQDEIENLKEISDLKKAIIKSVQESAIEQKKPEDPTVTFMDKARLKEIMPLVEPDNPYEIPFSKDTPFNEKAETLDNTEDIPPDFDESFFINTDHETQSNEKVIDEIFFEKVDYAEDAAELDQDSEGESDEYADQKYTRNNSSTGSNSQFFIDVLLESNTVKETAEVRKEVESEYDSNETYEDWNSDTEPEVYSGDQKGIADVLNNESGSKFLSFRSNIETVVEPETKVNDDGEELDDEGHVYPNVSYLAYY